MIDFKKVRKTFKLYIKKYIYIIETNYYKYLSALFKLVLIIVPNYCFSKNTSFV